MVQEYINNGNNILYVIP